MNKNGKTQRIWVIRAGQGGDAHNLFLEKHVVGLSNASLGDLTKLGAERAAFYDAYREAHPDETRTGSAGIAGKFFRMIHEVRPGDLMIYPALPNKNIYIGDVTGEYSFVQMSEFPHQRAVKWLYVIPKAEVSQAARYELGAARTFFEFKKNVQEMMRKIDAGPITLDLPKAKTKARK